MDQYLQHVIGVVRENTRIKLIYYGFDSFEALVGKNDKLAVDACYVSRKQGAGNAADKIINVAIEDRLKELIVYCNYCHLAQLPFDYNDATRDAINSVHAWVTQLGDDPETSYVLTYKEGLNIREWFESIETYLSRKKGNKSKMPLLYVIREDNDGYSAG